MKFHTTIPQMPLTFNRRCSDSRAHNASLAGAGWGTGMPNFLLPLRGFGGWAKRHPGTLMASIRHTPKDAGLSLLRWLPMNACSSQTEPPFQRNKCITT